MTSAIMKRYDIDHHKDDTNIPQLDQLQLNIDKDANMPQINVPHHKLTHHKVTAHMVMHQKVMAHIEHTARRSPRVSY